MASARTPARATLTQTAAATGLRPYGLALGDLDRDGDLDVVTANQGDSTISVLLNVAGTLGPKTDFRVGSLPYDVALADVNGDSLLDAVVANEGANTVSVLLGDGHGGFGPKADFATGRDPRAVAVRDLDGDSKPDIVVADLNGNAISVLRGDGRGGFGAHVEFGTGRSPYALALGDLNGDHVTDVVTADYAGGTVSVLLGNGAGGFGAASAYAAGIAPYGVVIADLDLDGHPDVAVSNAASNNVSILRGLGNGTLAATTNVPTAAGPRGIAVADFNHDSIPDLATADYPANGVTILIGNPSGSYSRVDLPAGPAPRAIATGSMLAESEVDVVVANTGDNSVSVIPPVSGLSLTSTSLTVSPNPATTLQSIGMVARVSRLSARLPLPGGVVRFLDGPTLLGQASLVGDSAVFARTLTGGPHTLIAVYPGDANWIGSSSPPVSERVVTGSITLVNSNANPVSPNQTITFTVRVGPSPGIGFPTGTVALIEAADTLAHDTLDASSSAVFSMTLPLGSHEIVAAYAGDTTFGPSMSAPLTQNVFALTTLALTTDLEPAIYGVPLKVSATVTVVPPGVGPAIGSVSFTDGSTSLGSVSLTGGVAAFNVSTLTPGTHVLHANYAGASGFFGSIAPPDTEHVTAVPVIAQVRDVPGDQGREVRVVVRPSPLDVTGSPQAIVRYDLFRRIDPVSAAQVRAHGWLPGAGPPPSRASLAGWDAVGSMGAFADTTYNIVVPTLVDSNATGSHLSTFFVRAATATPSAYFDSAPDSGYSVDDVAPSPPAAFAAARSNGVTRLTWRPNVEPDVVGYRLYRGDDVAFDPGPGNLLATVADTTYDDAGAGYYKLCAVDHDGNTSGFSSTDADSTAGSVALAFALEPVRPNPARTTPLTVRFTLPDANPATLDLIDVGGRAIVRRDVTGLGPGAHTVQLPESGTLRPGLYFVRLSQSGRVQMRRAVLVP